MVTYLYKILSFLLVAIIVFSCDFDKKLIRTNISSDHQPFDFFIFSDSVIYLLGNSQNKLTLYESDPKNLEYWHLYTLDSINGRNVFVTQDSFNLYISSFLNNNSQILSISKKDKKANEIAYFRNAITNYMGICDSLTFFIVNEFNNGGVSSVGYKIMLFDNGIPIDTLVPGRSVQQPKFESNRISFLTPLNRKTDMIYRISMSDSFAEDSIFSEGLRLYDFLCKEDQLLVLGEESDDLVLKRFRNGHWDTIKSFSKDLSGERVFEQDDLIAVLAYKIDTEALNSFGGTRYILFVSHDQGRNWDNIDLPEDIYVSPAIFTNSGKFISYSGDGHLTVIDLK